MATLRQKVDALLLRAEEADTEERIVEVLEGKKVEVSSRPSHRKTFGKQTPRFTIWIDGERQDWPRKNSARAFIIESVDPERIAERTLREEQAKANAIRREAEHKAEAERMKPLLVDVNQKVNSVVGALMQDWQSPTGFEDGGFTEAEILQAIQRVVSELRVA